MQQRSSVIEGKYILTVHRIGGNWEFTVEHDGDKLRLPGAVFDRMASYRAAIIKEYRKLQAQSRMRKIAEADQVEAEAEDGQVPTWVNDR